jgi:hypothetical protein
MLFDKAGLRATAHLRGDWEIGKSIVTLTTAATATPSMARTSVAKDAVRGQASARTSSSH